MKFNESQTSNWPALILLIAAAVALSACSLRYDFTECETNGDCARIENQAAGQLYQCVQNVCVPEANSSIEDESDAGADADDARESDSRDEPDAESTTCETTRQCQERFGETFYCAPFGECVDAAHAHCDPIYYPNDERGEIVLLGSIIPTQGAAYESLGRTIRNAVRMAVIEYASNALTLPGGATVAHLHCEGGSADIAREAAEHMRDIGVPIVVGPLTSSAFIEVVSDVGAVDANSDGVAENPMGAIAMGATATAIGSLDAIGKYAFQIISNDKMQASAMADRTLNLRWKSCVDADGAPECTDDASCQAKFDADYIFDADPAKAATPCKNTAPKIAVFYKDDQYGNGFHNLLIDRYFDHEGEVDVEYYKYPDPAALGFDPLRIRTEFTSIAFGAVRGDDAQTDTDLVVFIGTGEATVMAKLYIGALGEVGISPASKRYIFSHGAAADVPSIFSGDTALPSQLQPLFEAIAPNIFNQPYYDRWQNRYAVAFEEPAQTSVGGVAYDAAYLGIFAMAGVAAGEPVSGANVTAVIEQGRLQNPEGTEIILENATFPGAARQALKDGGDIDMVGVSGDLNFVIEGGENQGTVRANYLGLDLGDVNGDGVLEIIPTRIYMLADGENFGAWAPIPPPSE
jgi:hypothetical protein